MSTFADTLINIVFGICVLVAVGYVVYMFVGRRKTENFSVGGGAGAGARADDVLAIYLRWKFGIGRLGDACV